MKDLFDNIIYCITDDNLPVIMPLAFKESKILAFGYIVTYIAPDSTSWEFYEDDKMIREHELSTEAKFARITIKNANGDTKHVGLLISANKDVLVKHYLKRIDECIDETQKVIEEGQRSIHNMIHKKVYLEQQYDSMENG